MAVRGSGVFASATAERLQSVRKAAIDAIQTSNEPLSLAALRDRILSQSDSGAYFDAVLESHMNSSQPRVDPDIARYAILELMNEGLIVVDSQGLVSLAKAAES